MLLLDILGTERRSARRARLGPGTHGAPAPVEQCGCSRERRPIELGPRTRLPHLAARIHLTFAFFVVFRPFLITFLLRFLIIVITICRVYTPKCYATTT